MANHKSAIKRHKQNLKKKARNRKVKSEVKSAVKLARSEIQAKSSNTKESVRKAEIALAKAAVKGVINKKAASRRISRLAKKSAQIS